MATTVISCLTALIAQKEEEAMQCRIKLSLLENNIDVLKEQLAAAKATTTPAVPLQPVLAVEEQPAFTQPRELEQHFRYKEKLFTLVPETSVAKIIENINNGSLSSATASVKWTKGTKHHPLSSSPQFLTTFIKESNNRARSFEELEHYAHVVLHWDTSNLRDYLRELIKQNMLEISEVVH